jgi:prevent-host-death family protein
MRIASIADIKAHFSAYLKESEGGPVVVTRNGKAVAVLVALRDDDELDDLLLAHNPRFRAILETSRQQIREGKGINHHDFWAQISEPTDQATTPKTGTGVGTGQG